MTVATAKRLAVDGIIPRRLLDVTDAARYLSVSTKIIRQLIQGGELPYIQRIPGRSPYLIDIEDLDRWIQDCKTRA
jgi:excisionase family DNA binding protein